MENTVLFYLVFCGGWAAVGAIFWGIGLTMTLRGRKKRSRCIERVWGRVADILPNRSSEGGTTLTPLVEYETPQGLMRQCSPYSSSRCRYAIGQQVGVWYDPEDPSLWYLEGETTGRLLSVIFTVVGIVCLAVALTVCAIGLTTGALGGLVGIWQAD